MAKIVGYIATSLDGYIAGENGDLDWLTSNTEVETGDDTYEDFIKTIDTVVMGRATYEWLAHNVSEWPYPHQRGIVVTSSPIASPMAEIELWSDLDALITELRTEKAGRVWVVGGGALQMSFIAKDALDEIEIYVMAEILGGGTPLFPAHGVRRSPQLLSVKAYPGNCARLHYAFTDRAVV